MRVVERGLPSYPHCPRDYVDLSSTGMWVVKEDCSHIHTVQEIMWTKPRQHWYEGCLRVNAVICTLTKKSWTRLQVDQIYSLRLKDYVNLANTGMRAGGEGRV